jgi:hypothetical protein
VHAAAVVTRCPPLKSTLCWCAGECPPAEPAQLLGAPLSAAAAVGASQRAGFEGASGAPAHADSGRTAAPSASFLSHL